MITYNSIEKLKKSCLILMENCFALETMEDDSRIREAQVSLFRAVRKLTLATEFQNRQIISVSGLQGAGKTTMMQTFFGIPNGVLKVTTARGEQIPVLISEHENCNGEYEAYAVCLEHTENGYERIEKRIDEKEFIEYSSGDKADEKNIIYLELHLPYKRIGDSRLAFMLLPGFEDKQDYWAELIDFSLRCSNTAIFTFDQARYSKIQNKNVMEKVKNGYKDAIIYAITRSDLSESTAEAFREKCVTELKTPGDKVVSVGVYKDNAKNEAWIEKLSEAVLKHCNSGKNTIISTNEYIKDVIVDEILPQLAIIKEALNREEDDQIENKIKNNDVMNAFDKVIKKRRRKLSNDLKKGLENAEDSAVKKLHRIYTDSDYARRLGVREEVLSEIRRTLLGEKVEDKIFAQKRLTEAMTDDDDRVLFAQKEFARALVKTVAENQSEKYEQNSLLTDEITKKELAISQKKLLHDTKLLLAETIDTDDRQLEIPDIKKTCESIARMAESYMGAYIVQRMHAISPKCMDDLKIDKLQVNLDRTIHQTNDLNKVLLSGLGITGIDLLDDGVINAIPKIAKAMKTSIPVVGAVVAAIASVELTGAIFKDINRLQLTEESAAEYKIREITVNLQQEFLEAYDEAMLNVRERIENNIEEIEGSGKNLGKRINAKSVINDMEDQITDLVMDANEEIYNLNNAF